MAPISHATARGPSPTGPSPVAALGLHVAFFLSGGAALIYQVTWQRALFAIYGLDSASVAVVVAAFMLGLGAGSLLGGAWSRAFPGAAVKWFAACELAIGVYGFLSLGLFAAVAEWTARADHLATGVAAFLLVVFPTALMGATLPLLVAHFTARWGNVGRSVGSLYCVNALGAALGALLTVRLLFGALGLSGTVFLTALLNVALAAAVVWLARRERVWP
jgi:predicted membrane-bound spermidine synthase